MWRLPNMVTQSKNLAMQQILATKIEIMTTYSSMREQKVLQRTICFSNASIFDLLSSQSSKRQ